MKKIILFIFLLCIAVGAWFLYSEIYSAEAQYTDKVTFEIKEGESVSALAARLEEQHIIRSARLFKKYVAFKNIDRDIRQGTFEVESPITLARVVDALANPSTAELTITILPGWDLRDMADYFEKETIMLRDDFYAVVGWPAYDYKTRGLTAPTSSLDLKILEDKPNFVSFDGYLAPDTYRIFKDATPEEIVKKLLQHRDSQFTEQMYADIIASDRTVFEVLTMASMIEREVRRPEDRKLVSDLFWRRYDMNWALQADSSVHYAIGKKGDAFTTADERDSLSPWNTYRYPGLPLGPISTPSLDAIMAAIYPQENNYWYFLTDSEGVVHYGKTLEEHNSNRNKYL